MPSNCCVPHCVGNAKSYILLRFYRFPTDKKKSKTWKRLVRNDDLTDRPFVCSLHFTGGAKSYDVHTPTIFPWTPEWSEVVEQYNLTCMAWFNGQTGIDHVYAKPPKEMAASTHAHGQGLKHRNRPSKRRTTTSKNALLDLNKDSTNVEVQEVQDASTPNDEGDQHTTGTSTKDEDAQCVAVDDPPETSEGGQVNDEQSVVLLGSNTKLSVDYYPETHLMVKSELQTIMRTIQLRLDDKSKNQADINTYRNLLKVTLQLLINYTEMLDTVIELHNFNRFLLRKFTGSDTEIQFWTGFYSSSSLQYFIKPNLSKLRYWGSLNSNERDNDKCGPRRSMEPEDELFLTLVKLKQGSANEDLAERFCISESSVSRVFLTWIKFLETILTGLPIWLSRKKIKKTLPDVFKDLYQDVTIIIDCTEMECEKPSDFELQAATYSDYKSRNTVKALVGISPSGIPTFISDLVEGRVSDNEITMKSGLIEKMEPQSVIMADRGWTNKEALARHGIRLITPSFLMDKKQLDLPALVESVAIARVRIHVERCIGRIKQWKIITRKLPLTEWKAINSIWKVCAHLIVFWPPLL